MIAHKHIHSLRRVLFCLSISLALTLVATPSKTTYARLEGVSIATGPISIGMGGANPPSLSSSEHQVSLIFTNSEVVLSISPGIFYTWRSSIKDAYISIGPGVVLDTYGMGIGGTIGFGYYLFCLGGCLSVEYRQGLGFNLLPSESASQQNYIDIQVPYTIKLGISVFF